MLQNLHVKNLALIDEIEVNFNPGLNILTGETGAGKSIILGSIDLALGGKYSADMLRSGAPYGLVELIFEIDDQDILNQLEALEVYPEEGVLVLSRRLMEGRSTSKINGETVTKNTLQEVADLLIDVHGQQEHQTLLSKRNHLMLLDLYGGAKIFELKRENLACYQKYRECLAALEDFGMDESERKKESSFLAFEIQEIQDAKLQQDEDEILEEQYRRMQAGKKLTESTYTAYQYTSSGAGANASDLLSRAIQALSDIESFDKEGGELYRQLVEVDSLLNDFNRELSEYEKSLSFSEEEFYQIETRLNEINHLKSKYGDRVDKILTYMAEKERRLSELEQYESHLADLKRNTEEAAIELANVSEALSKARKKASTDFVNEISQGLRDLNFLAVKFEMRFHRLEKCGRDGIDEAEFYISTNPGEPVKALRDVASGGELSRIMLAIKAVLAEEEATPTLIFDEIDAGISGITAGKVAGKLHLIGRKRQVICITHLPQIAAMADVHYLIEKTSTNARTQTEIVSLDEKSSVEELARILGGERITKRVMETAWEMKEMAKAERRTG